MCTFYLRFVNYVSFSTQCLTHSQYVIRVCHTRIHHTGIRTYAVWRLNCERFWTVAQQNPLVIMYNECFKMRELMHPLHFIRWLFVLHISRKRETETISRANLNNSVDKCETKWWYGDSALFIVNLSRFARKGRQSKHLNQFNDFGVHTLPHHSVGIATRQYEPWWHCNKLK